MIRSNSITPIFVAVCLMLLVGMSPALAGKNADDVWFKGSTVDAIERSLAMALKTPSPSMQASASQVVRDLKVLLPDQEFSLLVIPLMRIVKDEDGDIAARMVSALALHELRSAKGDFAIQRTAHFSKNERVRHLCSWLNYNRRTESSQSFSKPTAQLHE